MQGADRDFNALVADAPRNGRDGIGLSPAFHGHLKGPAVGALRYHGQLLSQAPEAQESDAEFAVHALPVMALKIPLEGIADMRGHVLKIGQAVLGRFQPIPVVANFQRRLAAGFPPYYFNVFRARVDAVFNEFAHGLEHVGLRAGDDGYGVPLVSDAQLAFF
jgi:hypothetical protein